MDSLLAIRILFLPVNNKAIATAAMATAIIAKTTAMTTNRSRHRCEQAPVESRDPAFAALGGTKSGLSRCLQDKYCKNYTPKLLTGLVYIESFNSLTSDNHFTLGRAAKYCDE